MKQQSVDIAHHVTCFFFITFLVVVIIKKKKIKKDLTNLKLFKDTQIQTITDVTTTIYSFLNNCINHICKLCSLFDYEYEIPSIFVTEPVGGGAP